MGNKKKKQVFKDLFREFRTRNNQTKSELAKYIQKTDGYIRKIENDGYTPPTYDICIKLSKALHLNDEEKSQFLHAAFLGRIKSEDQFFKQLNQNSPSQSIDEVPNPQQYTTTTSLSKCTYCIVLETKFSTPILKGDLKKDLVSLIQETITEFNHCWQSIQTTPTQLTLYLDVSPTTNIHEFITGLKKYTSGAIRNQYKQNINLPSLWGPNYAVFTIGTAPKLDSISVTNLETTTATTEFVTA